MIPPYGRRHAPVPVEPRYFRFAEQPPFSAAFRLLGVRAPVSGVRIDDDLGLLEVRFGPWRVRTPLANVDGVELGGPYPAREVLGARVSAADRGLTFGTGTAAGVCIRFHRPVAGIEPTGRLRHPSLTVTVAQPERLAAVLDAHPHTGVHRLREDAATPVGR